jgi:hypothetical protein
MSEKKIIAVLGATGAQGGGLCRSILSEGAGEFQVRAITRDPSKASAQALASMGAEVVAADLDQVDTVVQAFQGAHGVFGVTNFWEHQSAPREKHQAAAIAIAAQAADVKHIVWSTLEDTRDYIMSEDTSLPFLQGKYRVPHLDCKNETNAYFEKLPTTYLVTSFFWENIYNFGFCPKKNEHGEWVWTMPFHPHTKLAGMATKDIGIGAHQIFKQGESLVGRTVGVVNESPTLQEMNDIFAEHFNLKVTYNGIEPETFRSFGFPGADELGNNFQYFRDCNEAFLSFRQEKNSRMLNPNPQSFREFVAEHSDKILQAMNS